MSVVQVEDARERSRLCREVLRALPEWFGIEEATRRYIDEVATLPTFATGDDGFLALKLHTPRAAEVYVMGVVPGKHRQRLGSQLLDTAERYLRDRGVQYLQVKTLGPSDPYEPYERTRRFYEAHGFVPLEETNDLWDSNPCLIMVKRL
jgi:GNAT superfamily N-acetyltransferase